MRSTQAGQAAPAEQHPRREVLHPQAAVGGLRERNQHVVPGEREVACRRRARLRARPRPRRGPPGTRATPRAARGAIRWRVPVGTARRRTPVASSTIDCSSNYISGMTTTVHRAQDRFHTQIDWLDSWHSFSFGPPLRPRQHPPRAAARGQRRRRRARRRLRHPRPPRHGDRHVGARRRARAPRLRGQPRDHRARASPSA